MPIKPACMRVQSAARYLDVSESYVRKLIGLKRLRSTKVGTAVLVLTESLDALVRGDG
jgi:excisionase family DNA binding protein